MTRLEVAGGELTSDDSAERRRADQIARRYAIGLFVAFLGLAVLVVLRWPPMVDRDLATDVAMHALVLREKLLLTVSIIVTNAGSPVSVNIITAVVAGGLLYRRRIASAVYLVAARLVELGVATAVKHLVGRPRPALPDPVGHASSFSFPSGHAAGTAVLCASLVVLAFAPSTTVSAAAAAAAKPESVPESPESVPESAESASGSGSVAASAALVPTSGSVAAAASARRRRAPWVALAGFVITAVAASRVLLGVHYPSDVLGGALLGIACALILRPLLAVTYRRTVSGSDPEPAHT